LRKGDVSTSIGSPNRGRLIGGVALPELGPGFVHNPRRPNVGARFGTVEMVQALMRAAATVDRELPGGTLTINDLGLEQGGPIAHHGSHQNGRDVDVLFYLLDAHGAPMPSVGAPLDRSGRGWDFKDRTTPGDDVPVRLDVSRTWRFMQALSEDSEAHMQRIFVAEHVRTLLVGHARSIKAPPAAMARIEEATCQPETPHDDHFHVRFFCTSEDLRAGCQDTVPMYEWRAQALQSEGLEPVIAIAKKKRTKVTPKSSTSMRELFNTFDKRVLAFLRKRETWSRRPHPGRRWCR
jgi:penicillin-insensitive murein DD-endopeptidase